MRRHGIERERESDGEKDKDRQKESEKTTGSENQSDMEIIVPAAYDTKHFHPVICSVLMSQRRTFSSQSTLNFLEGFGIVGTAEEYPPQKHYHSA